MECAGLWRVEGEVNGLKCTGGCGVRVDGEADGLYGTRRGAPKGHGSVGVLSSALAILRLSTSFLNASFIAVQKKYIVRS